MKQVAIKCPSCGASSFERAPGGERSCVYCKTTFRTSGPQPARPARRPARPPGPVRRRHHPLYYVWAVIVFGSALAIMIYVLSGMYSFGSDSKWNEAEFEKDRKNLERDWPARR